MSDNIELCLPRDYPKNPFLCPVCKDRCCKEQDKNWKIIVNDNRGYYQSIGIYHRLKEGAKIEFTKGMISYMVNKLKEGFKESDRARDCKGGRGVDDEKAFTMLKILMDSFQYDEEGNKCDIFTNFEMLSFDIEMNDTVKKDSIELLIGVGMWPYKHYMLKTGYIGDIEFTEFLRWIYESLLIESRLEQDVEEVMK